MSKLRANLFCLLGSSCYVDNGAELHTTEKQIGQNSSSNFNLNFKTVTLMFGGWKSA